MPYLHLKFVNLTKKYCKLDINTWILFKYNVLQFRYAVKNTFFMMWKNTLVLWVTKLSIKNIINFKTSYRASALLNWIDYILRCKGKLQKKLIFNYKHILTTVFFSNTSQTLHLLGQRNIFTKAKKNIYMLIF